MAMTTALLGSGLRSDGSFYETYECFLDGTTGTMTLNTGRDLRKVRATQLDTRGAAVPTYVNPWLDVNTGVLTVTGVAVVALTGVSGGSAGTHTFTGTGGVKGTTISGDANFAANTVIINVSGTTITVDKPLLGAIAAGNQYSHLIVEIIYNQ